MFVPAAQSKVAELDSQKFFRRNTTPLRVWRFHRNPLGLRNFAIPICVLPLPLERSNIRRQEDKMRWCGKRITHHWLPPLSCSWQRTRLTDLIRGCVRKRTQNKADEIKKWAVLTYDTECPCGFQFVSEDSRFRSSAISRTCYIAFSVSCIPTML